MGTLASELRPIAAGQASGPRVYADANVPSGVVDLMRRRLGWDVLFVLEEPELRRAADRTHFERARDLGRTLVTLDRDFLDALRFPPPMSPGVFVLVAPDERGLAQLVEEIDRALRHRRDDLLPFAGEILERTPASEPLDA